MRKKTLCAVVKTYLKCKIVRSRRSKLGRTPVYFEGCISDCYRKINLSRIASLQTFLHEVGHIFHHKTKKKMAAIYGSIDTNYYTNELIAELFAWLILSKGNLVKVYAGLNKDWAGSLVSWVSYYEKVSLAKAKKMIMNKKIKFDNVYAQSIAVTLYESELGRQLTEMVKDGAELGI